MSSVSTYIAKLTFILMISVGVIMSFMLVYAHFSLPENVDGRPFGRFEGNIEGDPKMTLINVNDRERGGRREIVLAQDWYYIAYERDKKGGMFPVPILVSRYFTSDFASVPFPFNRIINPFGRHAEAAIVHDWLYAIGQKGMRENADRIFYDAMRQSGVPWLRRRLMYAAVRLGGRAAYGRANEWDEAFFFPLGGGVVPRQCIIEKPEQYYFYSLFAGDTHQSIYEEGLRGEEDQDPNDPDSRLGFSWKSLFRLQDVTLYNELAWIKKISGECEHEFADIYARKIKSQTSYFEYLNGQEIISKGEKAGTVSSLSEDYYKAHYANQLANDYIAAEFNLTLIYNFLAAAQGDISWGNFLYRYCAITYFGVLSEQCSQYERSRVRQRNAD